MDTHANESTGTSRADVLGSPGETGGSSGGTAASPVDDHTYNVIQALTSTLEAIEAYSKYQESDRSGLFEQLRDDAVQHADLLLGELRSCLSTAAE
jgi:hypothetical protein